LPCFALFMLASMLSVIASAVIAIAFNPISTLGDAGARLTSCGFWHAGLACCQA
jgi:hypothetical protein